MHLLKELCEASGIPGREQEIIDICKRELKKTCGKVSVDNMGNVIGLKKSKKKNAKKVMIAGHMDEIGFVVSHIDKNGFIRFAPRGGHVPRVLISQRVKITGKKKQLIGAVESNPAFLNRDDMTKAPEIKNMFIDTGLPEKEVKKHIEIGDTIVLDRPFIKNGDVCMAKAFDDRVGVYIVLEVMKKLKAKNLDVDVYAVGTSQEEVGLRGAIGASVGIEPDIGIALDLTAAFDTPGVPEHEQVAKMGEGIAIKINDQASISNHGVVNHFKALAKKHKIPHQMEILPFGGTDARGMQSRGALVGTLSVPARYVHSPNEMVNMKDIDAGIDLLVKFIETATSVKAEF